MGHIFTSAGLHVMLQGFLLWISLIVALGPQNALIIKQGLRRHALGPVIAVCMLSDCLLVIGGIAGVDFIVGRVPWLLQVLRWAGVAFLLWFAFVNFKEARTPRGIMAADAPNGDSFTDATLSPTSHTPQAVDTLGSADTPVDGGSSQVATLTRTSTAVSMEHAPAQNQLPTQTQLPNRESIRKPVLAAIAMSWLNPGAFVDGFVMLGGVAHQYGDLAWALGIGALVATLTWFPALGFGARAMSRHLAKPSVWQKINVGIGIMMVIIAARLAMGV
ncbi:LysE/ArgO family amino acid transporter [Corynebacterium auriscanis]|uniref:LysE/ArgO family amino acid transporter n=1 Tax=Corynebacterium auriscanis TaxID=99807 RepID=UPI003CE90697